MAQDDTTSTSDSNDDWSKNRDPHKPRILLVWLDSEIDGTHLVGTIHDFDIPAAESYMASHADEYITFKTHKGYLRVQSRPAPTLLSSVDLSEDFVAKMRQLARTVQTQQDKSHPTE